MAVHVVNEKDVEKKKSGRGYTKMAACISRRKGAGDDDPPLGAGYGYSRS